MRAGRIIAFLFAILLVPLASAQQPWTAAVSPTTQTLWGVTYGGNTFVAVGEGGTILTSPDGTNWTPRSSGTTKWLLAVTWEITLNSFVAVGDAGTILTSPDGTNWTPRSSGTTQRLNSVAWSPKRFTHPIIFLAVGENGTALVSTDLATWTLRPTGDSGWLRGIAGGLSDGFVITGHDGTILTTHDAGETFVRRASGTTLHLDAVARWGSDFFATGSNFALSRSNFDGTTWVFDRTVNPGGQENGIVYNGVVAFNNALVLVGDQGRIIDEAGRRWATTEPLFPGWRAVAASRDRVVAVGTEGGIASAPLDPGIMLEHDLSASFLADYILLEAKPRRPGASLASWSWSVNGVPIPGAPYRTLTLNTASGAQDGLYTFSVTDQSGRTSSASITIESQPNPAALGLVDPGFRPALSSAPGPILVAPDGRIYVSGRDAMLEFAGQVYRSPVRLRADGTRDPTFNVADGALTGTPVALILQPDGRLVVLERQTTATTSHRAVRLNATGSIDESFQPDPTLVVSGDPPTLLADGRWLAVERQVRPISTDPATPFAAVLRRYLPDGRLDPGYSPRELMVGSTISIGGNLSFFAGPRTISTRDSQDRIYLGIQHGDRGSISSSMVSGTTRLFRLAADGTPDASFSPRDVGGLYLLSATPQGLVARTGTSTFVRLGGTTEQANLLRLSSDGTVDPSFRSRSALSQRYSSTAAPVGLGYDYNVLTVLPDGRILVRMVGHLGRLGLVRFTVDGDLDANFNAELGSEAASVSQIHALPDGRILVAGTFRSLLGVGQPYLARLTPNTRAATTHLANLSVRARAGTGDDTLIAGYVTERGTSSMLARGIGPALGGFGLTAPLADPELALYSGPALLASNDDWSRGPADLLAATASRVSAFPLPVGSADAALHATVPPGAYTTQVSGKNGATGIALLELYAADPPPTTGNSPRVVNFSVRTRAGTGDATLITGFTLAGENTRNILIRAIGPALAAFGINDSLPDPVLTLYRGSQAIATNDDWALNPTIWLNLKEAFGTVGAFPLPATANAGMTTSSKDAALLISLAPGSYTVQVSGKGGASGIALVEIYEIP